MNHHSLVKMPNSNSQFNRKHEVEFGLVITETGTVRNEVESVSCRFCSYYGRNGGQAGKRKRTNNVKFFRSPFLPSNYRVHLESQHAEEWADHSSLRTLVEKTAFFEQELFGNTILSHVDLEVNNLRILINKPIVDNLIGELLLRDEVDIMEEDDDEMVLHFKDRAIDWFRKPFNEREGEEDQYCVIIKGKIQFNMIVRNIANGLSFDRPQE